MGFARARRSSLGIGAKTLISHLTLAVAVIVLTTLLSYMLSAQYIRGMRRGQLSDYAQQMAATCREDENGRLIPSRKSVRLFEDLTHAKVFFLDVDGESMRMRQYSRNSDENNYEDFLWVEMLDSIDRQFGTRVLSGETVSAVQRFEFAQEVIIFAGAPIRDDAGNVRGGIILVQPVTQLHTLSRAIRLLLLIIMAVAVLLAVVLSMQQTRMLVGPIQRLTLAARRMEDGVYAERIRGLPGDEIGELGRALNSMSGRLLDVIRNLRKERDKLQLIISDMGEGLIAYDRKWRIVHVNQAFLEFAELPSAEVFMGEMGESPLYLPLRQVVTRCMETGSTENLLWTNPSGRALHATVSSSRDEDGEIQGTICLLRDVSEAQRMEQLSREYIANISHELRTPLTGIRGMVEPLIDGIMETEEERDECYRVILKETIRLEKLVGEMLDLSRLQEGRVTLDLEPMELRGILESAMHSMDKLAAQAGVTMTLETDDSPLACMGDENRITQVLVILIDNALSFTPTGGKVTVFARDDGDHIAVGVRDTGCGIEPKDLPLIFERFYKADKSRMRTTGTGLGLSIARLVTRLMGGDISARSEPGKGAEFTFTLKKAEDLNPKRRRRKAAEQVASD
ncbi:MAG: ATP-binding protein [Clostridia bacterium]|nr:ATP-binding protein [Clostridia bacterium]